MSLLDQFRQADTQAPHLDTVTPPAAMPGGILDVRGVRLAATLPIDARIGETAFPFTFCSNSLVSLRVPEGAIPGDLTLRSGDHVSNALPVQIAVPISDTLHPITNPAVDMDGNVYATFSGTRGQAVPVSIFRLDRDFQQRPFVRDLTNASGLAFGPDGYLYCSSRAEGTVYRISPSGSMTQWAEGMGVATGLAFDAEGNLYVGDRSGTIFKINSGGNVFVFATLEPSVSAYHLAFNDAGTLFVTGPTTSSNEVIHAISPDGEVTIWFRGLGRPQGLAVDRDGNVYVAASHRGERGIHRITPRREISLAVSGSGLVGLAFLDDGAAVLATTNTLYHVEMGVTGRLLG
ncbi:Vgb family protein [Terriglobus aquaticus]|uniref:Gluconolaconase n=1 Tax=Terriglobus aquaticus TaxID=940139 RepID=A0ABW9KM47_9BACT|nr:gluconolaconase [Terriglobus aquaticus]